MVVKYSTEHLECRMAEDFKGQINYQIFEKDKNEEPVIIYVNPQLVHISEKLPANVKDYEYFKEAQEIITTLLRMEA